MAVHQGVGMAALTALVSNKRHHHHRLAQAKQINDDVVYWYLIQ